MNERGNGARAEVDVLPPHTREGELGLLGCCMLGGVDCVAEALGEFGGGCDWGLEAGVGLRLNEEGAGAGCPFFDLRLGVIFGAMVRLWNDRKAVDVFNVAGVLEVYGLLEQVGGVSFVADLPEATPSAANLPSYLAAVRDRWLERRMLAALTRCQRRIRCAEEREGLDTAALLDGIEAEILAVNARGGAGVIEPIKAPVLRNLELLENYKRGVGLLGGMRTHFGYLDKMTGGLHRKQMIVIAARPGCGKTSFAMNIVEAIAVRGSMHGGEKGAAVGVFTMEMSADDLSLRMLCGRSGADFQRVRTGFASERDFELLAAIAPEVSGAPIYFDETPALDITEMRARARRMVSQFGVKLIVIDYLQLGCAKQASRRNDNRAVEVSAISAGCKAMAKELDLPVVVLSQLNRETEKSGHRRPQLSDLRESGAIEQDADVVMFLWQPKMDEDSDEFRAMQATETWPLTLTIGKQRNGPTGDCELLFEKPRMRLRDRYDNKGRRD